MIRVSPWVLSVTIVLAVSASGHAQTPSRCIALPLPALRGAEGGPNELATGVRDLVSAFLKGPSLQTIALEARLPDQILEEARERQCNTVLTITLTRKKAGRGGLGKVLGDAAGAAAWHLPYGGSAAKSTAIRSAAIAGTAAASTFASNTRAKDELQIEYRLALSGLPDPPGVVTRKSTVDATLHEGKDRIKASSDGEDLVTPLVERMAGAVSGAVPR